MKPRTVVLYLAILVNEKLFRYRSSFVSWKVGVRTFVLQHYKDQAFVMVLEGKYCRPMSEKKYRILVQLHLTDNDL